MLNPSRDSIVEESPQTDSTSEIESIPYERLNFSNCSKQKSMSSSQNSIVGSLDTLSRSPPKETPNFGKILKLQRDQSSNDQQLWDSEVRRRRSLNYPAEPNETLKQSKTRFSDSRLFQTHQHNRRDSEPNFRLDPRFSERLQREAYYHPGVYSEDSAEFETEQFSCFNSVTGNIGPLKKRWLWRFLAGISMIVVLFYLGTILPIYMNGQRSPIKFRMEEEVVLQSTINERSNIRQPNDIKQISTLR